MSKPIERIKEFISTLPKRDIPLGYKFLENRDFESLTDLVDSAIYRVIKNLKSETPKEEYLKISLDELNKLKSEVDLYCAYIPIPGSTEEYFDEDFYDERTEY